MSKKKYTLYYRVFDAGFDTCVRMAVVKAFSIPYAVEELNRLLGGFYRSYSISRVVREVYHGA